MTVTSYGSAEAPTKEAKLSAGWGEQLQEWIEKDQYRHYARQRILEGIYEEHGFADYLDVGCGSGALLRDFSAKGVRCMGVDLSEEIIRYHARERFFPIVQATADDLPFADSRFEMVTCLGLVEHLSDARVAMRELHRVTKPGGVAIITVPRLAGIFPLLVPFWFLTGGRYRFGWKNMVGRMYRQASFRNQLEVSGWHIERLGAFKGSSVLEWLHLPFSKRLADLVEGNWLAAKIFSIMLVAICRRPA